MIDKDRDGVLEWILGVAVGGSIFFGLWIGFSRRWTAEDFGDDPGVRRKYGEAERVHSEEPWEQRYEEEKESLVDKLLAPLGLD